MVSPLPTCPDRRSTVSRRTSLSKLCAEVRRSRPHLPQEGAEFRAAILLLVVCEAGFNVHRTVLRIGLPREFVSRCLRRLADNGLWIGGQLQFDWLEERAESPHFWLDVEVALGRKLRRIGDSGNPEWAPAGGWMKDFEYARVDVEREDVHALYHDCPEHNPEPGPGTPLKGSEDGDSIPAAPKPDLPARAAKPGGRSRTPGAPSMIREWQEADWLG